MPFPALALVGFKKHWVSLGALCYKKQGDIMFVLAREHARDNASKTKISDGQARFFQHFTYSAVLGCLSKLQMSSRRTPVPCAMGITALTKQDVSISHNQHSCANQWSVPAITRAITFTHAALPVNGHVTPCCGRNPSVGACQAQGHR